MPQLPPKSQDGNGGNNPNHTRERRISVRIPLDKFPGLERRLARAAKTVGVDKSVLVLAAVDGVCDFIEKNGKVAFPVRLTA
jgi:hypothetical protein